jgi:hypothetical protein
MAAILRAFSHAMPLTSLDVKTLKLLALFCGAGGVVLLASYGLDLSPGFF